MVFTMYFVILYIFMNVVFLIYVDFVIYIVDYIIILDVFLYHSNPCHSLLVPLLLACNSIY
jgi:hypothetical protein